MPMTLIVAVAAMVSVVVYLWLSIRHLYWKTRAQIRAKLDAENPVAVDKGDAAGTRTVH